ncbi:NADH:riboflavin 5'-phosphate oxidoreductase [Streptomyces sp. p1417]|uniref:NADH:riboflavin 5'-phosphate oxidoreductase n=1 Tax=Streptomyces typhae TaxID=2681492 RepID=A0A6L6X3L9_9ACTN|nr:flavin reductase family protein [Streptomyces typhae]MVO88444.1 NADH:riboflavin 5'-phosphate oxidoreductase [Streptomyces typhae]
MSPVQEQTPAVADAQAFKDAMALLAAPVSVVTTVDDTGRRWGFTASSVSSVSLSPPLVMVGIALTSSCHTPMSQAREFVINVLDARHRNLAQRFAARGVDRFADGDFAAWQDGTGPQGPGQAGLPYLPGAKVLLRCRAVDTIRAGDHDLLLGTPLEIRTNSATAPPLLWYQRGFHTPVPSDHTG